MDRDQLDKIEEEEKELIRRFKNNEIEPSEDIDLSDIQNFLIKKLEEDYQILDKEEFKKQNLGTLQKIHEALKKDEPEILKKFGIVKKK